MATVELDDTQQLIFDLVSDAIVVIDARQPGLPIVAANRVCRDVLAPEGRAIIGRPWDTVLAHTTAHGVPELLQRSIATGEPFAIEGIPYVLGPDVRPPLHAQQLTYWDCQGTPVRGQDGRIAHLVLIMADVTGRRASEQADQEKDAFLSLISHEIRSPLTAIKGFAQLATRGTLKAEGAIGRTARYLRAIDQQTDRIGRLLSNLSDVARFQGGRLQLQPDAFDLVPLVRTTTKECPIDPEAHEIDLIVADEALVVHADRTHIGQMLANLLANAIKYSSGTERIAVMLDRQGDYAHLAVRDEGIGIPRDELLRIFGRFYRAANSAAHGRGGLGLGLFIVHQIVTHSGGQIYAESEVGRGSTFHVTLPLARAEDRERTAEAAQATRRQLARGVLWAVRPAGA